MANRGGTEVATLRTIKLLNQKGLTVYLGSNDGPLVTDIKPYLEDRVKLDFHSSFLDRFSSFLRLIYYIRKKKIDVIHCQMAKPVIWCILARLFSHKINIVWHSRGLYSSTYKFVCPLFDFFNVTAVGNSIKEMEKLIRYGYQKNRVFYCYNPLPKIEENNFSISLGQSSCLENKCVNLVSVSRLAPERNVHFLLSVAKALKERGIDFSLNIIGGGTEYYSLEKSIEQLKLGGHVNLINELGFSAVCSYYFSSDISLSPINLKGDDGAGVGNNNIEAGLFGLPCVAFDSCAVSEVIIDGVTGYCIPVGDNDFFIKRVIDLIEDKEQRCRLGNNMKEHVLKLCGDDDVFGKLMQAYSRV